MKYIVAISVLFFFAGINTGCKKSVETIVKTDTVRLKDTLRDTAYIQLIRTDIYRGSSTIKYWSGLYMSETLDGIVWVKFFANDSTNYFISSDTRPTVEFSIVSGHFWYSDGPMSVTSTLVAPDSLYITAELGKYPSARTLTFRGKKV